MTIADGAARLAAVNTAATLGRLADGVVVAAIHWEQDKKLGDEDRARLQATAGWLNGLVTTLTDPLDLPNSLAGIGELGLLSHFGQSGKGLAVLLEDDPRHAGAPPGDQDVLDGLRRLVDSISNLTTNNVEEDEVIRLRQAFDSLARALLATTESLLEPVTGTSWTTSSGF